MFRKRESKFGGRYLVLGTSDQISKRRNPAYLSFQEFLAQLNTTGDLSNYHNIIPSIFEIVLHTEFGLYTHAQFHKIVILSTSKLDFFPI